MRHRCLSQSYVTDGGISPSVTSSQLSYLFSTRSFVL